MVTCVEAMVPAIIEEDDPDYTRIGGKGQQQVASLKRIDHCGEQAPAVCWADPDYVTCPLLRQLEGERTKAEAYEIWDEPQSNGMQEHLDHRLADLERAFAAKRGYIIHVRRGRLLRSLEQQFLTVWAKAVIVHVLDRVCSDRATVRNIQKGHKVHGSDRRTSRLTNQ
jgi:hypothetical protein